LLPEAFMWRSRSSTTSASSFGIETDSISSNLAAAEVLERLPVDPVLDASSSLLA
jgi:hypothetical protein